ncbi:MAG: hypothetical protein AAGD96_00655 [Chloroflexota bacterium]
MHRTYIYWSWVVVCLFFVTGCDKNLVSSNQILFLQANIDGVYQLNQVDPESNNQEVETIAVFDQNILDFAVSPSHQIVLTLEDEDQSHDIWGIVAGESDPVLLISCQDSACSKPRWAPQGDLFVFERRPIIEGRVIEDEPTLWWFDLNAGQAVPVFADDSWFGQETRFSPDGGAISYFVQQADEIQIYDLENHSVGTISTRIGSPAEWGTDGQLYFSALFRSNIHIFKTNPTVTELDNLSGGAMAVEDAGYLPSPDGESLLFTRKPQRVASGRQIMIMNTDGSDQQSLTNELDIQHGAVSWSPDGQQLVFQKFNLSTPNNPPTIWVMDVATGESREIIAGTRPQWVP